MDVGAATVLWDAVGPPLCPLVQHPQSFPKVCKGVWWRAADGVKESPGWCFSSLLSSRLDAAIAATRQCFTHIYFASCVTTWSAPLLCVWVWATPSSSLAPAVFSVAVEVCRAFNCCCRFLVPFKMETTALLQTASHIALGSLLLSSLFSFYSFALLFRDLGKLFSLLPVKLDVKREARLICEALKAIQTFQLQTMINTGH